MNSTTLTDDQKARLAAPFAFEDHYVRQGSGNKGFVQWLVYAQRQAIIRRVHDVVGFQVSDTIVDRWYDENTKDNSQKYGVVVRVELDGICHESIGTDTDYMSAETRAFKRAMTHFEVGLYLYDAPKIQTRNDFYDTESKRVTNWDNQKKAEQDALRQVANWLKASYVEIQKLPDITPDTSQDDNDPIVSPEPVRLDSQLFNLVMQAITPMHNSSQHAENTLKKLLTGGEDLFPHFAISQDDDGKMIAMRVLLYRCFKDFDMDSKHVLNALGVDALGAYTGKMADAYNLIKQSQSIPA